MSTEESIEHDYKTNAAIERKMINGEYEREEEFEIEMTPEKAEKIQEKWKQYKEKMGW